MNAPTSREKMAAARNGRMSPRAKKTRAFSWGRELTIAEFADAMRHDGADPSALFAFLREAEQRGVRYRLAITREE